MLGTLPTQQTIIAERFFDESGGMQLIIHAPFGSRVNRAWGLALRKRFCRQFNFELQAAATDEAILLSLGPQHSFPLENVFRFLQPETVEDILVQALLDAPMFGTHWRWNATIALAIPRQPKRAPAAATTPAHGGGGSPGGRISGCGCMSGEHSGDREVPDHPLVRQTVDDCVRQVMDVDGLIAVLEKIRSGEIRCIARDLPSLRRSHRKFSTPGFTLSSTTRRWRSVVRMRCTLAEPSSPATPTTWAGSIPRRSIASARRPGPTFVTRTSCTMRCSVTASSPRTRSASEVETGRGSSGGMS